MRRSTPWLKSRCCALVLAGSTVFACGGAEHAGFIDPAAPAEGENEEPVADAGARVSPADPDEVKNQVPSKCTRGRPVQTALVNGDFEEPAASASFMSLDKGDKELTGWSITAGNLDVIGSYWMHASGSGSLDMNGTSAAAISQSVATETGEPYELRFELAGNPDAAPNVKVLNVSAGDSAERFSFDVGSHSRKAMGWKEEILGFVATGKQTELRFESRVDGNAGPALDNVRLFHVPCER